MKNDREYNVESIRIYPLLIVHDRQFDTLGINKLLQKWFSFELQKIKDDYPIDKIFPLTIINIDSLIRHQNILRIRGKLRLENLIEEYHNFVNVKPEEFKSYNKLVTRKQNSFISL